MDASFFTGLSFGAIGALFLMSWDFALAQAIRHWIYRPSVFLYETRLRSCLEVIRKGDFSEGYCCCGDPVDGHSIGSGHGPVDMGDYYVNQFTDEIEKFLADAERTK